MSNREGAGRVLGNFYSKAGSSLEKLVHWDAAKDYYEVIGLLEPGGTIYKMLMSKDLKAHEKACDLLLRSARRVDSSFFNLL